MSTIDKLAATIAARASASGEVSYTAKLLSGGIEKCAKKFGEEAFELAMAAVSKDKAHTANEAADVIYHLLVLLQASGVPLAEVEKVLAAREAQSGLEEKARRG
ncbi:MAG: phosphoribosyl-ATP diphosphatase [Alphaproteobacteria bacterium]|nr:phosphoribosyl-ATP diphosphatase [Alphaproteobacteria bacterium]